MAAKRTSLRYLDSATRFVERVVVLVCVFICIELVLKVQGQANGTVRDTGSSSDCICDLVVNGCDPNCCCDVNCSPSDKESFTECKESKDIVSDDRVCVSDQMIFIENVPFTTKNTGDGLFCIIRNNNEKQDQYSDVGSITDNDEFTNAVNSRNLYAYDTEGTTVESSGTARNYKVGDRIILVFSNQTRGYLSLPIELDSTKCNDFNAAGFFQDAETTCVRTITNLETQCSDLSALAATSYYTGFQVVKTPMVFSTSSKSTAPRVLGNESSSFSPSISNPLLCRDSAGVLKQCSFSTPVDPTYNSSTKTCEHVVSQVAYTFIYSNESTVLEKLNVSLVFENVQGNFFQKFSVRFLKDGTDEIFTKSGNPGYLIDHPVVAGLLVTGAATKEAIHLSTNKKDWLTIPKASLDGSCSDSVNERQSVTFNVNARSGCIIRLNKSSNCSLLQAIVFTALLGVNPPDYVASFGNSDVRNVADWVKIINDQPGNSATGNEGICENMVLGMHIEILFAKMGYLANPQAKIVGVRFKYEQAKTITYQCFGQFCLDSDSGSQSVEVVSSVSFIDVSQTPSSDQKSLPEFQSKAPSDFFHPFL